VNASGAPNRNRQRALKAKRFPQLRLSIALRD
jgi:hypothetical protein